MKRDYSQLNTYRQEHTLKSLYYNRYFMIRYVTIFFFFNHLYWFLMFMLSAINGLIVLPVTLLILNGIAVWEQTRLFTTKQKQAKYTMSLFKTMICSNVGLLVIVLLGHGASVYPFLNVSSQNVVLTMVGALIVGIAISLACIQKLNRINSKSDKQYKRIEIYLKNRK